MSALYDGVIPNGRGSLFVAASIMVGAMVGYGTSARANTMFDEAAETDGQVNSTFSTAQGIEFSTTLHDDSVFHWSIDEDGNARFYQHATIDGSNGVDPDGKGDVDFYSFQAKGGSAYFDIGQPDFNPILSLFDGQHRLLAWNYDSGRFVGAIELPNTPDVATYYIAVSPFVTNEADSYFAEQARTASAQGNFSPLAFNTDELGRPPHTTGGYAVTDPSGYPAYPSPFTQNGLTISSRGGISSYKLIVGLENPGPAPSPAPVPLPAAAWGGVALLGGLAAGRIVRPAPKH